MNVLASLLLEWSWNWCTLRFEKDQEGERVNDDGMWGLSNDAVTGCDVVCSSDCGLVGCNGYDASNMDIMSAKLD